VSRTIENWASLKLDNDPVVLLGNGASRAIDNDSFDYPSLLSRAKLRESIQNVFASIGESDFEKALRLLEITKNTNSLIGVEETVTAEHVEEIRSGLINAVRSIHPTQGVAMSPRQANKAIKFLSNFKSIFTLNYDFFLYWLIQKSRATDEPTRYFRDWFTGGFFKHDWPEGIYLDRNGLQCAACYFLHGALHLIDDPEQKIILDVLDEASNQTLIKKVSEVWKGGRRPLFVSEGTWELKEKRIEESKYLRHAFGQFKQQLNGVDLVIYGASLSKQDQHLVDAINSAKPKRVFVGIHNPSGSSDPRLAEWKKKISASPVTFFNATSKGSWIY
tara:strand:+ start:5667 stop:6662 length:996 start_codon:yes stop_codon:yes gene_type:complete